MTSPSSASPSRPRCSHKSQNGKPCRYSAMSGFRFCKHHVPDDVPPSDDALAAILAKAAGHLSCPEDVRRVMAAIFHALVQHRLSSKDAGVLCYIAQTILHSLRTSAYLDKAEAQLAAAAPPEDEAIPHDFYGQPIVAYTPPQAAADNSASDTPPTQESPKQGEAETPASAVPLACPATGDSGASASSTSPASSTSSFSPPPPRPPDLSHFFPWDPTLPRGLQDPHKNIAPPSQEELDRRNACFDRVHGYRNRRPGKTMTDAELERWIASQR